MMYGFGWNGISGWGWIGMTVMMVFWVALLALVIYAVSRAFSQPTQSPSDSGDEDLATRALRERFARGEITEDEYRQVSSTLRDMAH